MMKASHETYGSVYERQRMNKILSENRYTKILSISKPQNIEKIIEKEIQRQGFTEYTGHDNRQFSMKIWSTYMKLFVTIPC